MTNLTIVEQNNQRVLTTEQMAEVYGTDVKNISKNFNRNKDKFIEGKHFFLLQGSELKAFKTNHLLDESFKRVNQLYLWTERGASRHCKILDTDNAWQQFDNLEETYFKVKAQHQMPRLQDSYMIEDPVKRATRWIEEYEEKKLLQEENQVLKPKAQKFDQFLDADGYTSFRNVGMHFLGGISAQKVAKFLIEKGVLCKKKTDGCYVQRQGYDKYFKRVPYDKRNWDGTVTTVWNLKFTNEGINYVVDLFQSQLAAR